MKKNNLNSRGISYAETIIAVSILILILGTLSLFYVKYSKFYNRQQTEISISNSAREAVKELQSAALQADHIIASHTFSGITYTTDQHTLVLEIPSVDGSGDIIVSKYDYIVFYLTGKNLYRRVGADAASSRSSGQNQLSDAVSTLTFTYNNPNLALASKIDVNLQMQKISGGQTISYNLHQEIYLRNL